MEEGSSRYAGLLRFVTFRDGVASLAVLACKEFSDLKTSNSKADWERSIIVLTTTVVTIVIVGCLYWSRDIVIPIALAIFLTFVLSPIVNFLSRTGFPRVVSVVIVLCGLAGVVAGLGMLLTVQSTHLMEELPKHRDIIRERVKTLRTSMTSESSKQVQSLFDEMWREFVKSPPTNANAETPRVPKAEAMSTSPETSASPETPAADAAAKKPAVVMAPSGSSENSIWTSLFSSTASALGTLALTLVLVAFMLVKREDLRDRFLRLVGDQRLAATTMAMDDAGRRISKFLLMQFAINSVYGIVLGLGLWLLGVPYAVLWGVIAGIFRYIPYLGAWLSAIFPVLFSLATSHEWAQPLLTIGFIVLLELVTNNVFEPLLYGSSLGISQVALIVSAAFWAFLWGPVGLILSNPLTVILLILGQRVPQFRVLHILLGEDTPLATHIRFFQRLIAGDQDEASVTLAKAVADSDQLAACDNVLLPALNMIVTSKKNGEIGPDEVKRVNDSVIEIVDDIFDDLKPTAETSTIRPLVDRPKLLILPVDAASDAAALHVLVRSLESTQWNIQTPPREMLVSEVVDWLDNENAEAICIVGLEAGSRAHTRYLCKRLTAREVTKRLLVSRLGDSVMSSSAKESFTRLNALEVSSSLAETLRTLGSWFPVACQQENSRVQSSVSVA